MEPPRVDQYYTGTFYLQLPDSAPWAILGERPQPGQDRFQSRPSVQAQPSTGWPVLQPAIPSYGSRVPLRRPSTLLAGVGQ